MIYVIRNSYAEKLSSSQSEPDESGAPKSCMFGGTTRGRVSSQCLKRSWRISPLFSQAIGAEHLGIRTRQLPQLVAEKLAELGVSQEYIDAVFKKSAGLEIKRAKRIKMAVILRRSSSMHRRTFRQLRMLSMR